MPTAARSSRASADLLLLRDDPLATTGALDTIDLVILAGRAIPRAELAAR